MSNRIEEALLRKFNITLNESDIYKDFDFQGYPSDDEKKTSSVRNSSNPVRTYTGKMPSDFPEREFKKFFRNVEYGGNLYYGFIKTDNPKVFTRWLDHYNVNYKVVDGDDVWRNYILLDWYKY